MGCSRIFIFPVGDGIQWNPVIFSAEYCFTPEEALDLEGDNKFNTELLSEQLARINIHKELPPDGAIQSGHLDYTFKGERKDENITGFH